MSQPKHPHELQGEEAERFWEERYQGVTHHTHGNPGWVVRHFVEPLAPGRALELGCGRGDDAVWLARQGWAVVATDISTTALDYAAGNAQRAGVAGRLSFVQHDLAQSFPEGQFDLVLACFLAAYPLEPVLQRAAQAVASGGHLLLVHHGTPLPWSRSAQNPAEARVYPTAEETLASLALDEQAWTHLKVGAVERPARGPEGQTAQVEDAVVFLQRR